MTYRFLRFPGGKSKAVTFSYDDGVRHDIRLAETLCRYGLKGTFNVNPGRFGTDSTAWNMTADEIEKYIVDAGHELAVHGNFHLAPGQVRPVEAVQDVLNCRLALESRYGRIIRGMAYPDTGILHMNPGHTYEAIRRMLQELDITYARTLGGDNNGFALPSDWYAWMPTLHHDNPNAFQWAQEFVAMDLDSHYRANRYSRLFYVWGHSYEFEVNNNWDRLEQLCQLLSGRDDIWYATNGEIFDYVHAFDSLVFSADGKRVYNPTLVTLWFWDEVQLRVIEPGQTLVIE